MKKSLQIFFLTLLALLLLLPALDNLIGLDPVAVPEENRAMSLRPTWAELSVHQYFRAWDSYARDHFGFRSLLVFVNSQLRRDLFGNSSSHGVLFGVGDQLFLGGSTMLNHYRNITQFDHDGIKSFRDFLKAKGEWVKSQKAEYVFVALPESADIMTDKWMPWMKKVSGVSSMDQARDAYSAEAPYKYVDVREVMRDAYAEGKQIYHKKDSHWNSLGASLAFRDLDRSMQGVGRWPSPALKDENFRRETYVHKGDLELMLGFGRDQTEMSERVIPVICDGIEAEAQELDGVTIVKGCILSGPVIYFAKDSFGHYWTDFLRARARLVVIAPARAARSLSLRVINRWKPDIFIDEVAHRSLIGLVPPSLFTD